MTSLSESQIDNSTTQTAANAPVALPGEVPLTTSSAATAIDANTPANGPRRKRPQLHPTAAFESGLIRTPANHELLTDLRVSGVPVSRIRSVIEEIARDPRVRREKRFTQAFSLLAAFEAFANERFPKLYNLLCGLLREATAPEQDDIKRLIAQGEFEKAMEREQAMERLTGLPDNPARDSVIEAWRTHLEATTPTLLGEQRIREAAQAVAHAEQVCGYIYYELRDQIDTARAEYARGVGRELHDLIRAGELATAEALLGRAEATLEGRLERVRARLESAQARAARQAAQETEADIVRMLEAGYAQKAMSLAEELSRLSGEPLPSLAGRLNAVVARHRLDGKTRAEARFQYLGGIERMCTDLIRQGKTEKARALFEQAQLKTGEPLAHLAGRLLALEANLRLRGSRTPRAPAQPAQKLQVEAASLVEVQIAPRAPLSPTEERRLTRRIHRLEERCNGLIDSGDLDAASEAAKEARLELGDAALAALSARLRRRAQCALLNRGGSTRAVELAALF